MAIIVPITTTFNPKGLDKAIAEIKKAEGGFAKLSATSKILSATLNDTGTKLTRNVTAPLAALGGAAVTLAIGFDSSMTKIVSLVGIAANEVDEFRTEVLKLAGQTAKAPVELADGLFVLTSAGLRGKDALDALEASAKASAAGLGQTNDIARAVAGAMTAYGTETLNASKATDIITATARAGNFEVSQFSAALGRVLPFAKQAGASLEDVGGAVALLTRTNGDAAQSVTQVQALLRAFVVPTQEAVKALDAVGLSAGDLRKAISTDGLPAALDMLDDKLGGNREQLGRILGSSEAASAAFQILDADADSLAGTFGVTNKALGMTQSAFDTTSQTAGFKLQKSLNNLKVVAIELGDTLVPFVEKLSSAIEKATTKFQALTPTQRDMIVNIGLIAAVIGPALLLISALITAMINLSIALGTVGTAIALVKTGFLKMGVAATMAGTMTVAATTIMKRALITTGVGALVVGLGFVVSKFYDAAQAAKEFGDAKNRALKGQESRDVARSVGRNVNPNENQDLAKSIENLNVELTNIKPAAVNAGKSLDKTQTAVKGLSTAGKIAKERMGLFAKDIKRSSDNLLKLEDNLKAASDVLETAKEKFNGFKDSVKDSISSILNFGSAQNQSSDSVKKAQEAQDDLTKAQLEYDNSLKTDNIEDQQKALENLQAAQTAATDSITKKKSFIQVLQEQADLASTFANKVQTLISMGLSETAIGQVLSAGADAGSKIADEIIAGGATVVDQVNTLVTATESVANALGTSAASQFYSAGVLAGQALVDGVKTAISEATAMFDALKAAAANAGFTLNASGELENTGAKKAVAAKLREFRGKKSQSGTKLSTQERQTIIDLANSLGVEIPAMAAGGIVTRPTLALIGEAGPEAVIPLSGRGGGMGTNITINVNAGMGADGASIGREIVDAIKKFERSSGPVFASA